MKKRVVLIIIILLMLYAVACGKASGKMSETDVAAGFESEFKSSELNLYLSLEKESSIETEESFQFIYKDATHEILFEDCTCEYDQNNIKIYSKYIRNGMGIGSGSDFPYFQYVLYIQTPISNQQIFPVKDYRFSQNSAFLYLLREEDAFHSIQKINLQNLAKAKRMSDDLKEELLNEETLHEMLTSTHQLSNIESGLSGLHFELIDTKTINEDTVLTGIASGMGISSNTKYYIDFEWNETLEKANASPCILRIYDPKKDAEIFTECQEAFDRIKHGDWSMVTPDHNVKEKWEQYKIGYWAERSDTGENSIISEDSDWRCVDINNDGLPELVSQCGNGDRTEHKKPIAYIFAWNDDKVELVYIDLIDAMEFLFLSDNGKLIYESSILGMPQVSVFTKFHFDEKWNLAAEESLKLTFDIDDKELHYQRLLPDQTKEDLTHQEFINAYLSMTGQEFTEDHASYWEERFKEAVTEENLYEYEIKTDENGAQYAVLRGFKEEYEADFKDKLRCLTKDTWKISFPERLDGIPVKEISAYAFQNINLGSYSSSLELSSNLQLIGEHCFENCGIKNVIFDQKTAVQKTLEIGSRAFADNKGLWGVYLNDTETHFGTDVFVGCADELYLCYNARSTAADDAFLQFAETNHLESVDIPLYLSSEPIVKYPETPYTLLPEVRNFFYGDSADDEAFCSFEYNDNALDFGFPEWHLPCGELCAMWGDTEITASSELASGDERYSVRHLNDSNRNTLWAEGVSGYGIGESISISENNKYGDTWNGDGSLYFLEGDITPDIRDGYMRYTEICVVNGYAKSQKNWEENGRVKRLLLYVEDRPYAYLELEDTMRPQYFSLPINDIKTAEGVTIHFKFVIEDIYPGTKYEDTCLTGLKMEFMGRRGH